MIRGSRLGGDACDYAHALAVLEAAISRAYSRVHRAGRLVPTREYGSLLVAR
jgi:hypothetical protein